MSNASSRSKKKTEFSLTRPVRDSIYIPLERGESDSTTRFDPTCQLNSPYLTVFLSHDLFSNLVHIQLKSRAGIELINFTGFRDRLVESTGWSLISQAVRNSLPSSCEWAGDLLLTLRRETLGLPSMDSPARTSRKSTVRLVNGSRTGISTDTESPRSKGGSSSSGKTGGSQRPQLRLVHQRTDSGTGA